MNNDEFNNFASSHPKLSKQLLAAQYEAQFESRKWTTEIPFIQFKSDWLVKLLPPFASAIVRFKVKKKNSDHEVSIYLDGYNLLGYFYVDNKPSPYWEIYPDSSGDTSRFEMNDIDGLLNAIERCFE